MNSKVVDIVCLKVGAFGDSECTIHMPRVEELCETGETRLMRGLVREILELVPKG